MEIKHESDNGTEFIFVSTNVSQIIPITTVFPGTSLQFTNPVIKSKGNIAFMNNKMMIYNPGLFIVSATFSTTSISSSSSITVFFTIYENPNSDGSGGVIQSTAQGVRRSVLSSSGILVLSLSKMINITVPSSISFQTINTTSFSTDVSTNSPFKNPTFEIFRLD